MIHSVSSSLAIGWCAGGEIDDAQPAVAERGAWVPVAAGAVRTAVADGMRHPVQNRVGIRIRGNCDVSGNAAHKRSSSRPWQKSGQAGRPVPHVSQIVLWDRPPGLSFFGIR